MILKRWNFYTFFLLEKSLGIICSRKEGHYVASSVSGRWENWRQCKHEAWEHKKYYVKVEIERFRTLQCSSGENRKIIENIIGQGK